MSKRLTLIVLVFVLSACAPAVPTVPSSPPPVVTIPTTAPTSVPTTVPTLVPTPVSTTQSLPTTVPPTPVPQVVPQTYTVQEGDTLSQIAAKYHLTVWFLAAVNNIWNPDYIVAGQVLKLSGTPTYHHPEFHMPAFWIPREGQVIVVDRVQQRLSAFDDGVLMFSYCVSTGAMPGNYTILSKAKEAKQNDVNEYGSWVMVFYKKNAIRAVGSIDCGSWTDNRSVNMNQGDAAKLYRWAQKDTPVYIIGNMWDP